MNEQKYSEKPEVYALRQDGGDWQISRRSFLKAAGIGAAALGAGLSSGCAGKKPLDKVCGETASHMYNIMRLLTSPDGKYLLSADNHNIVKCWDFDRQTLTGDCNVVYSNFINTGMIHGIQALAGSDRHSQIIYYKLPIQDSPERDSLSIPYATHFVIDSDENIFTVNGNSRVERFGKEDNYQDKEILYEPSQQGMTIENISLFDHEKRLFIVLAVKNKYSFAVLDIETGKAKEFEEQCKVCAPFRNENKALLCNANEYRLVDLGSGETLWSATYIHSKYPNLKPTFYGAAVMEDGSTAVLLSELPEGGVTVHLISIEDGSELKRYAIEKTSGQLAFGGPAFNSDETKCAVSEGKSLFFFSLPELKLLACPVDINEAKENTRGVEATMTDSLTGETYTCTLPCGAALPEGAICTCNCVTGRGGCACVGHSNSGGGGGSHYWHPN